MFKTVAKFVNNYSLSSHLFISLAIRLLLIVFSEFQDKLLTLKYTDIDYQIFTDGAHYVARGESPFKRDTYRYTPLLAILMVPNITTLAQFGKILFSFLDVISGALIYVISKNYISKRRAKVCATVWLYNPLPVIISTRGSAESVVTSLVLLTIYCLVKHKLLMAGLFYGFVIHFKLYPIIYIPSLYLYLTKSRKLWKAFRPNVKKLKFFSLALIGFLVPTYWSYSAYGQVYLDEAWLYHLHRKDPQHNFSPYFYVYHLVKEPDKQKLFAYMAFIPQALFVLGLAFYYCLGSKHKTQDMIFATFAQTMAFVTLNKVITSQYFLWYLCLLPLIMQNIRLSAKQWLVLLVIWLLSQGQWLLPAYLFEFQHWNCLSWVWLSSIAFLVINIFILFYVIAYYDSSDTKNEYKLD